MRGDRLIAAGVITAAAVALGPRAVAAAGAVLSIQIAILLHELGHLAAARAAGVAVAKLQVGFGPLLAVRRIRGLRVELRALPVGGAVMLREGKRERGDLPGRPFDTAPIGVRLGVFLAGPATGLLVAAPLLIFSALASGAANPVAGAMAVFVEGIGGIGNLLLHAPDIFLDPVGSGISGPVGIIGTGAAGLTGSVAGVLLMAGALSIGVSAINLLPVPPIDGGAVVRLFIGAVAFRIGGERARARSEAATVIVGAALVLSLILRATIGDITRLLG